jgi:hypothetical protein
MKNDREFTGTLLGFDDFVSAYPSGSYSDRHPRLSIDMVLDDVTEL